MDRRAYSLLLAAGLFAGACTDAPTAPPDRSRLVPRSAAAATPRPTPAPAAFRMEPGAGLARGTGAVDGGIDQASFAFEAVTPADDAIAGDVTASGMVDGVAFRLKGKVDAGHIAAGLATLEGRGTFNGLAARFIVRAQDGAPDAFALAVATDASDYHLAGTLARGDVTIRPLQD